MARQRIARELRKNCAELRAAHRPPARHQALVRVQPHIVRRVLDGVEGGGLGGGRLGAQERSRDVGVLRRAGGGWSDFWWQGRMGV